MREETTIFRVLLGDLALRRWGLVRERFLQCLMARLMGVIM
ncbi:hypothetical protein Goshw_005792 [Gossypium schwendimanii]|uniref:Uncharacterized protein n=1 Tax=Gossypium schwendimanii TaxID=34291 RepID=A0A7J9MZ12_GOSSC|nr:hypothetical protein [Gossypium schwendimanii]